MWELWTQFWEWAGLWNWEDSLPHEGGLVFTLKTSTDNPFALTTHEAMEFDLKTTNGVIL